jgi:type IV pilus biogenesis/stability protein PilW
MLERVEGGLKGIVLGVVVLGLLAGCASQEAAKKRIKEAEGYYHQGLSVMETDQQRAFVAFQKAVQLNPANYDAHYALGHIYFLRQEYAEAERVFRIAIELDPLSGDALNYLGRTLIYEKRYPEAVEVLTRAIALPLYAAPDQAYVNLANALELQGDNPGAVRALQSALKIDPPNVPRPLTYLMLGRVYMKQGEDGKAREALAQVKSLDPNGEAGAAALKMMERLR